MSRRTPTKPARVAVDLMGADQGPEVVARGALQSLKEEEGVELVLIGDRRRLESLLDAEKLKPGEGPVEVIHTDEVAAPNLPASTYAAQRGTSLAIAARLVREGKVDAMVSAGATKAICATAIVGLGRLPGIKRPALSTLFPTVKKPVLMLDVGATVDAAPDVLYQFGVMGSAYMREAIGRENPRVGLLSIGEEAGKGNSVVQKTFELFEASDLNFVGNAEGRDLVKGEFDVIVCDAFVGNSMLKFGENLCRVMLDMLGKEFAATPYERLVAKLLGPSFRRVRRRVDGEEWGGAPLLGLKGVCVVSDTSSNDKAIKNAIHTAVWTLRLGVTSILEREVAAHQPPERVASTPGAGATPMPQE
jgi:glycerol-3-phosphate acyltransferase PlsX